MKSTEATPNAAIALLAELYPTCFFIGSKRRITRHFIGGDAA